MGKEKICIDDVYDFWQRYVCVKPKIVKIDVILKKNIPIFRPYNVNHDYYWYDVKNKEVLDYGGSWGYSYPSGLNYLIDVIVECLEKEDDKTLAKICLYALLKQYVENTYYYSEKPKKQVRKIFEKILYLIGKDFTNYCYMWPRSVKYFIPESDFYLEDYYNKEISDILRLLMKELESIFTRWIIIDDIIKKKEREIAMREICEKISQYKKI